MRPEARVRRLTTNRAFRPELAGDEVQDERTAAFAELHGVAEPIVLPISTVSIRAGESVADSVTSSIPSRTPIACI